NVISGNAQTGVATFTDDMVAGNFIGTDRHGTRAVPNGGTGIVIFGPGVLVGTDAGGDLCIAQSNLNSGNATGGRTTQGADAGVAGNSIGTDVIGTQPLGNIVGINIGSTGPGARIGTDGNGIHDEVEGNLISGNGYDVALGGSSGNVVAGNLIGTDVLG